MKKQFITLATLFLSSIFLLFSCSKDNGGGTSQTKTQMLTTGTWKFKTASANGVDISNQNPPFMPCNKDNILAFTATASGVGTGTMSEGTTKCIISDPDSTPFNWNFAGNETQLQISAAVIPGANNDFTLEALSASELTISFGYAPTAGPIYLIKVTFQH